LDRDGVLNRRVVGGYVTRPEDLLLLPVAIEIARMASAKGVPVVIVSNQGAIARQVGTESEVLAVNAALLGVLAHQGIKVDGVYVCPHHPEAVDPTGRSCGCRKPRPGLLLQASFDLNLDLRRSVLVGDQPSDVEAATSAGIPADRAVLVDEATGCADLAARVGSAFD
jgi:D-glycero-D-manno-heptose 1,7-bisphosphate phosphatase